VSFRDLGVDLMRKPEGRQGAGELRWMRVDSREMDRRFLAWVRDGKL
jgi:hypothetical protein